MKKIFLSACIAAIAVSIAFAQEKKDPITSEYQRTGAALPPLRIVDSNRVVYTQKNFHNKHNFFLFMFNPTCGHCINMAKLVCANPEIFKQNKIAFMAGPQMFPYLNNFYQSTGIGEHPEITVGVDSAYTIEKIYSYKMLPQLNIYDKNNKLITIMYSDIPLDSLKKYAY
jgi:hypothetical protein